MYAHLVVMPFWIIVKKRKHIFGFCYSFAKVMAMGVETCMQGGENIIWTYQRCIVFVHATTMKNKPQSVWLFVSGIHRWILITRNQ